MQELPFCLMSCIFDIQMCKGRHKYQGLIEEIRSTTALRPSDIKHIAEQKEHSESVQQEHFIQQRQVCKIQ